MAAVVVPVEVMAEQGMEVEQVEIQTIQTGCGLQEKTDLLHPALASEAMVVMAEHQLYPAVMVVMVAFLQGQTLSY
jgi:hypothetical protein